MGKDDENPNYLTVPEAARIVGLTEDAIRKAIRSTKLPGTLLYGRLLVTPTDLDEWNRMRRTGRPPKASAPADQA